MTSPVNEGMFPDFMMNAQMANSVPRMGRRSMSPFMRGATGDGGGSNSNGGGFRFFASRPRRRISPYNPGGAAGFRFVGGPNLYQVKRVYRDRNRYQVIMIAIYVGKTTYFI